MSFISHIRSGWLAREAGRERESGAGLKQSALRRTFVPHRLFQCLKIALTSFKSTFWTSLDDIAFETRNIDSTINTIRIQHVLPNVAEPSRKNERWPRLAMRIPTQNLLRSAALQLNKRLLRKLTFPVMVQMPSTMALTPTLTKRTKTRLTKQATTVQTAS